MPFNWDFLEICSGLGKPGCDPNNSTATPCSARTGFFVYAEEHAREWVGPLVALETANRLLKNYGTDPETTAMVDNLDIFVLPAQNPDGSNLSALLQGGGSGSSARTWRATAGRTTRRLRGF